MSKFKIWFMKKFFKIWYCELCGNEMKGGRDMICYKCNKEICTECSDKKGNSWYCYRCI